MPSPALRQSVYTTAWREPYILHSYMHMYVHICVYGGAGFKVIMKINETQNNPKRSLGDAFIGQAVSIRTRAEFGFLAQDGLWPTAAHGSFDGWFRRSSAGGPAADSPPTLFFFTTTYFLWLLWIFCFFHSNGIGLFILIK